MIAKLIAGLLTTAAGSAAFVVNPVADAAPPREICSEVSGNCFYGDPDIWEYTHCNSYDLVSRVIN